MTFMDNAILEGVTPQQELPEGQTRESSQVETLLAPIPNEVKDTQVEELGVPPISQEADELDAAEEPTYKPGHADGHCGGASRGARYPPMQQEVGEQRKVPSSNFPGWTEIIHPTWLVAPARWTPWNLGELRWHHHSQSLGGRRAQCWQAEECIMAEEGESGLSSSWESPLPDPGVAPPPGFREVVACLMRDPPSLAPIEALPETRLPNVIVGPAVATLSATWIVQDEATGVTYVDTVTASVERVALGNPHMAANLQGPMLEDITDLN